ncbi:hypothetical protein [Streptomyces sp. NBC_01092]|uniref:hypothetical protein n=1 Tax=Streptomyces sp. NBC_01092 TaxID=2903748 RepID=UPI00386C30E6|nr:hypothetical protein OG254_00760 [Streptomyces sp. NBC_01092]
MTAYDANPARLLQLQQEIEKNNGRLAAMLEDFKGGVAETRGWPGEGDSFAGENGPRVEREDRTSVDTLEAIAEAISAAGRATKSDVESILRNQGDVMDAVAQERRRGGRRA